MIPRFKGQAQYSGILEIWRDLNGLLALDCYRVKHTINEPSCLRTVETRVVNDT